MIDPVTHTPDRIVFYSPFHQFAVRLVVAVLTGIYLFFIPEYLRIISRWQILLLFAIYVPFHVIWWINFRKRGATVSSIRLSNWVDLISSGLMVVIDPYPIPVTMLLLLISVLGNGFQHGLSNFFTVARNALFVLLVVTPIHYILIDRFPPYPFYFFLCLLFVCTFYTHALVRRIEELVHHTQLIAKTDELTGLMNRRAFHDSARYMLSLYDRTRLPLVLVFSDLDGFKKINDTYGHETGDEVLRFFADRVKRNLRATDIAARYGGDEFVFILTDSTRADAVRVMERLQRQFREWGDRNGIELGVSWGIQKVTKEKSDLKTLLIDADQALYESKKEKRRN